MELNCIHQLDPLVW